MPSNGRIMGGAQRLISAVARAALRVSWIGVAMFGLLIVLSS